MSKYNFNNFDSEKFLAELNEKIYNVKEEVKSMENKKSEEVKINENCKEDLHKEMDLLEGRIYGFMKPYLFKIRDMEKNVKKLMIDKETAAMIKDLKKKGYTFENEAETLEQMEVDYLRGLGFKFNKAEVK